MVPVVQVDVLQVPVFVHNAGGVVVLQHAQMVYSAHESGSSLMNHETLVVQGALIEKTCGFCLVSVN